MDRFVAMIWDQEDPTRQLHVNSWSETLQRQSPKWKRVLDQPGLRVFSYHHRGDGPVVTRWQGDHGIVVGVLFERGQENKGRVQSLDPRTAERVIASRGDELIKNYWGNYLALWRNPETREASVLRDPCGAVPCFMTRQQGIELLFAYAEDVADLPGLSFTVDWEYLKAFQLFNYFITEHTGLNEVKELLGGERSEYLGSAERRRSWAWNGAEIAANPRMISFEDAKAELRETVMSCFTAWGREYQSIIIQMSGGLDSSILASIMRRVSDARVTGLHFVSTGYEQKEVMKARLAAACAGVELIEMEANAEFQDVRAMFDAPRLARPSRQVENWSGEHMLADAAMQVGANCYMAGHGGDNLFLQGAGTRNVLVDYLRLKGIDGEVLHAAYSMATLQGRPVWSVLSVALGSWLSHKKWRPFTFLNDERINRHRPITEKALHSIPDTYRLHPWFERAAHLPPCKAEQLLNIMALNKYYSVCGHSLERDDLNPYFSQPIVEFVLRTPSYVFVEDGLDRALERRAFADLIPSVISRRVTKGVYALGQLAAKQNNIDFYRALVLDGSVMNKGWLDRARLELMLTPAHFLQGGGSHFIDSIAVSEVWLRSWSAAGECKAA